MIKLFKELIKLEEKRELWHAEIEKRYGCSLADLNDKLSGDKMSPEEVNSWLDKIAIITKEFDYDPTLHANKGIQTMGLTKMQSDEFRALAKEELEKERL